MIKDLVMFSCGQFVSLVQAIQLMWYLGKLVSSDGKATKMMKIGM